MMKNSFIEVIAFSIVATIAGYAAVAAAPMNDTPYPPRFAATVAAGSVNTNNAISAFILPGGTIVRSKGVASVSNPSTGLYCLALKRPTVVISTDLVPVVSVDWSNSIGNELVAYYRSSGTGCPTNNLAILTYTFSGGTAVLSSAVAFTVVAG